MDQQLTNLTNNIRKAIIEENLEQLKQLLKHRLIPELEITDLLCEAVIVNNEQIIDAFLNLNYNFHTSCEFDGDITSVPIEATKIGNLRVIKKVIPRIVFGNATVNGNSPIYEALRQNNLVSMQFLIENGANLNHPVGDPAESLLHKAISSNKTQATRLLIEKGANVHSADQYGQSAIIRAMETKNLQMIEMILQHGGNPNAKNFLGMTPLHIAMTYEYPTDIKLTKILISHNAELNAKHYLGLTPLAIAIIEKRFELCSILINAGTPLNTLMRHGQTYLMLAVRHSSQEIMKLIINKGVDIESTDHEGRKAMHYALMNENSGNLNILINSGANIFGLFKFKFEHLNIHMFKLLIIEMIKRKLTTKIDEEEELQDLRSANMRAYLIANGAFNQITALKENIYFNTITYADLLILPTFSLIKKLVKSKLHTEVEELLDANIFNTFTDTIGKKILDLRTSLLLWNKQFSILYEAFEKHLPPETIYLLTEFAIFEDVQKL